MSLDFKSFDLYGGAELTLLAAQNYAVSFRLLPISYVTPTEKVPKPQNHKKVIAISSAPHTITNDNNIVSMQINIMKTIYGRLLLDQNFA